MAAVALPARADFKIVSKTTVDGRTSVTTQYRQGQSFRRENRRVNCNVATIFHGGSYYLLDLQAKRYVESSRIDPVLTLATWLRRPPRVRDSGKTVNVYLETVDTGERRQMFGYTARHLITRERQVAEQGACFGGSETEKDGWYIPYAALGSTAFLHSYAGYTCTDRIVTHGAKEETGFSVQETTTTTPPSPAGFPSQALSMTIQVIDFSEAPLDKSLFAPPPDFQRVDSLSGDSAMTWFERVEFAWREFEQAVASWFE